MSERLIDSEARERFRDEWDRNFAVSANAGSGKTTAISERLAAMALAPGAAGRLRRTAVVTYTKKAAVQIGQRARQVLLRRIQESGTADLSALDQLERTFFGTIHSFCLKLANTYGQTIGINLNPTVIAESDEELWEEFVEQDSMAFTALNERELDAFLRHVPLEDIFRVARELDRATASYLQARPPTGLPHPAAAAYEELMALVAKGNGAKNLGASQARARAWSEAWDCGVGFLPLYEPAGSAKAVVESARAWMAPLKRWLADAAAVLAAELADRYREWRFDRGVQTYADQVDAALAVLHDDVLLDRIRDEGWRIVLDEAQDTDPQQFAVLVELTRPRGARRGTWPVVPGAVPPRPGHFCMVGDGQQAIYGSRADISNFTRHVDAFERGEGGELLQFQVSFRAPHALLGVLNATLPAAFGPDREENFGPEPAEGAPPPFMQVPYVPLEPGPRNEAGALGCFSLEIPANPPEGVEAWLAEECRQLAAWLRAKGPAAVGVETWGDVAVLAPRNDWLLAARKALESVGLEVALQTRRNRCGDNPAYAWLSGLLAVCADPENMFEWTGVLREIFAVSDGMIAAGMRERGRLMWEEPDVHPEVLAMALQTVRPFVLRVNDDTAPLGEFVRTLAESCGLMAKAQRLDPSGGIAGELERLLAGAAEAGLTGTSAREWLEELLGCIDDGRPAGKPSLTAINLLTSHSAKGLEWHAVIVIGLWRGIGQAPDRGLKLVREKGGARLFFDSSSLPPDSRLARDRERMRELTRLLYVTLTRPRRTLVVPWAAGFGGRQREKPSFAELWGIDFETLGPLDDGVPAIEFDELYPEKHFAEIEELGLRTVQPRPALPARVLPHELAKKPDFSRSVRHEAGVDAPRPPLSSGDAIDYGLWWHDTMEFVPWGKEAEAIAEYGKGSIEAARALGFGLRAEEEWKLLLESDAWRVLCEPRWTRLSELGIFAPLREDAWIDGVIDLVLHDLATNEVWVVDWKTNRRSGNETVNALLKRLIHEYTPQLKAYGSCLETFFQGADLRLLVYSSAGGEWGEVDPS